MTDKKLSGKNYRLEENDSAGGCYKKFIMEYIRDRIGVILLFLATAVIYIAVSSLYQLHIIPKMAYAFLITLFLWGCFGTIDCIGYCRKRYRLMVAARNPEQVLDVMDAPENSGMSCLDIAYGELIGVLDRDRAAFESREELRRSEMTDYYLMWAHQIKTPIAAIKLLLEGREDSFLLTEELFKVEQYVEMVLHYLRIESISSDMVLKEYDLHQMVRQSVKKYSVLFINSGLSLKLEEFDLSVLTDEKWLCFVLEQLISNSIKYTKKGIIHIYMDPGREKVLVIEDTGIGIRQEDLPRIFERGFTGYNGRMDKKSTGIGLYLCKLICGQLSHGIWVESGEGKGTRAYLDLSREDEKLY